MIFDAQFKHNVKTAVVLTGLTVKYSPRVAKHTVLNKLEERKAAKAQKDYDAMIRASRIKLGFETA